MRDEELLDRVRVLRERRFTPGEIGRALGVGKAEAARLVRVVACEEESQAASAVSGTSGSHPAASQTRCWVSPGWHFGLRIDGHSHWPQGAAVPTEYPDGGLAMVLIAEPRRRDRLSVCGYLVDTWCLGVKNAFGPRSMGTNEFVTFKRDYFEPWDSECISVPLELAQHLVFGVIDYARGLGFEPHRDFRRARQALGAWNAPSAITFGLDGEAVYVNGPYDDEKRVVATLERTVGRGGYHFTVSPDEGDRPGDGYFDTATLIDLDELGDAA